MIRLYPHDWIYYDMAEDEYGGGKVESDAIDTDEDVTFPPPSPLPPGPPGPPPPPPPGPTATTLVGSPNTNVIYDSTGTPTFITNGVFVIGSITGNFNALLVSGGKRDYTITGDIGSKFNLTISDNSGCDIFNHDYEIVNTGGYVATVTFPRAYEHTTYTFKLRVGAQTITRLPGSSKIEYVRIINQHINPTITLSHATDDPYTTNCAYTGDDTTFTAKPGEAPAVFHTKRDKTYGKLTHAVTATITTGYLYIIKTPSIRDYLLLDNRQGLSTADLDKVLKLGVDLTSKSGIVTTTESSNKKSITTTSTVQIEKVGIESTVYELDIDSIITNIPQAFEQEVSTAKDTAVVIDVFKDINISTYLTAAITLSPKHGVLSGGFVASPEASVGTCTYTPPDLFQGVDEFEFEVSDGTNTSEDQYIVTINVGNASVCS